MTRLVALASAVGTQHFLSAARTARHIDALEDYVRAQTELQPHGARIGQANVRRGSCSAEIAEMTMVTAGGRVLEYSNGGNVTGHQPFPSFECLVLALDLRGEVCK